MQRIPGKFVREFGYELSNVVTLTVLNGNFWQVWLEKASGRFGLMMVGMIL
jgi:hypothetical protein